MVLLFVFCKLGSKVKISTETNLPFLFQQQQENVHVYLIMSLHLVERGTGAAAVQYMEREDRGESGGGPPWHQQQYVGGARSSGAVSSPLAGPRRRRAGPRRGTICIQLLLYRPGARCIRARKRCRRRTGATGGAKAAPSTVAQARAELK